MKTKFFCLYTYQVISKFQEKPFSRISLDGCSLLGCRIRRTFHFTTVLPQKKRGFPILPSSPTPYKKTKKCTHTHTHTYTHTDTHTNSQFGVEEHFLLNYLETFCKMASRKVPFYVRNGL